ncbi:DNA-binding protein [Streptococcus satellite phage Javan152]|uniref:helix-turn-helix domain-containing protein n=1 Tax=Streptococcus pyogenes TaxID=1314 RepID=UPI0010A175F9|nr:helix-turn-helix transcriptional regulator [Streptococcus pyogenes]QBX07512.1 DNA-binding protein [Streptococcus satellite phage Javan152]VGQ22015.1 transcriptional regulator [Streptococcus pyogenes]
MNRIKELRNSNGMTQKEFAEKIVVPLRTLQKWENEEVQIKPDNADKLARYFNVSVGYLLGFSSTKFESDQIKNEIEKRLKNTSEEFNSHVFNQTLKLLEEVGFLDLDMDTIVDLYFYNTNIKIPIRALSELLDFFDDNTKDYMEMLSIVEPYEADSIIQTISKLGDYSKNLTDYLNSKTNPVLLIKNENGIKENSGEELVLNNKFGNGSYSKLIKRIKETSQDIDKSIDLPASIANIIDYPEGDLLFHYSFLENEEQEAIMKIVASLSKFEAQEEAKNE